MKTTIVGDALVITSDFTLDQLKTVEKYRPDALKLKGGEDGKEVLFVISTSDKPGTIGTYGAIFGSSAHDGSDKATITLNVNSIPGEDKREAVAEVLGPQLTYMAKIEDNLQSVIDEIEAEKAAVLASITLG